MNCRILAALSAVALMGSVAQAQTLPTHRIPGALAIEAASETVAACANDHSGGFTATASAVVTTWLAKQAGAKPMISSPGW